MPNFLLVIIAIVIISAIVGAVARLLNNMNEMNNAQRNRPPARAEGGVVRQSNSDMDRFLAEIDRLRKKNADAPPPPAGQAPVAPVVQPVKTAERPRARVVAELAETPARPTDTGFGPPALPTVPVGPKAGDLPVAAVVTATSGGTGAPAATRVTRIAGRARPTPKTPFAKNLTTLLGSGQGLALAIVLQEVLGPPPSKKR